MAIHRVVAAATLSLLAFTTTARGEEDWYGDQILYTDAGATAILIASIPAKGNGLDTIGVVAGLIGGPVVHGVHDNIGRMGASLGMRAGFMLVGAVMGSRHAYKRDPDPDNGPLNALPDGNAMFVGAVIGYVVAAGIDALLLAREDKEMPAARMFSIGARF